MSDVPDGLDTPASPGRTGAEEQAAALAAKQREQRRFLLSLVSTAAMSTSSAGALGGLGHHAAPTTVLVAVGVVALLVALWTGVVRTRPFASGFVGRSVGASLGLGLATTILVPISTTSDARVAPALILGGLVVVPVFAKRRAPAWVLGASIVCGLLLYAGRAAERPPLASFTSQDGASVVEQRWESIGGSTGLVLIVRPTGTKGLVARPVLRCGRPGFVDHLERRRPFYPTTFTFTDDGHLVATDAKGRVRIALADGRVHCEGFGCGTTCAIEGDELTVPLRTPLAPAPR